MLLLGKARVIGHTHASNVPQSANNLEISHYLLWNTFHTAYHRISSVTSQYLHVEKKVIKYETGYFNFIPIKEEYFSLEQSRDCVGQSIFLQCCVVSDKGTL